MICEFLHTFGEALGFGVHEYMRTLNIYYFWEAQAWLLTNRAIMHNYSSSEEFLSCVNVTLHSRTHASLACERRDFLVANDGHSATGAHRAARQGLAGLPEAAHARAHPRRSRRPRLH